MYMYAHYIIMYMYVTTVSCVMTIIVSFLERWPFNTPLYVHISIINYTYVHVALTSYTQQADIQLLAIQLNCKKKLKVAWYIPTWTCTYTFIFELQYYQLGQVHNYQKNRYHTIHIIISMYMHMYIMLIFGILGLKNWQSTYTCMYFCSKSWHLAVR